jgi:hypothetical protein
MNHMSDAFKDNSEPLSRLTHKAIYSVRDAGLPTPYEIGLSPFTRAELLKRAEHPTFNFMSETYMGMPIRTDTTIPRDEARIRYIDGEGKPREVRLTNFTVE